MNKVRTLFLGTSDYAVEILKTLYGIDRVEVVGVVTQPDKIAGRKKVLKKPAVKEFLEESNINVKVFQPFRLKAEFESILETTEPELIVVAAYGQIIPRKMIEFPRYGSLNVHGSILPNLRGAVPVQIAILKGYETTGVTIQKMVYEMDEGDVVAIKETDISEKETTSSLMKKLAMLGAELFEEIFDDWVAGKIIPIPQDSDLATYCYQSDISKEKAEITSDLPLDLATRMIFAFDPWPIAHVFVKYRGEQKRLQIFDANPMDNSQLDEHVRNSSPGKLVQSKGNLYYRMADGALQLLDMRLEGKNRNSARNYLYLAE